MLGGCMFSLSPEIKRAEHVLAQFKCHNIESRQISHSPIMVYHEQSLAGSKEKARHYIEQYKNGEKLFHIPLDDMVKEQYEMYKSACQALGGIVPQ